MEDILLEIDTHERFTARVALVIGGTRFEKISESTILKSQTVLPLVEALLAEQSITYSALTGIRVHTGPGSFTGVRIGVSIANCLAFLLGIPVNGNTSLARASYTGLE
jgi:tRNA threonylcarbamoyladenosine biosynthesis protein TsaB